MIDLACIVCKAVDPMRRPVLQMRFQIARKAVVGLAVDRAEDLAEAAAL